MGEKTSGVAIAECGGNLLAGALGWLLVLVGSLSTVLVVLRTVGDTAPTSPVGSALAFAGCVLVIAVGLYGNPRVRECIRSARR